MDANTIFELAKAKNGKRRNRIITMRECVELVELMSAHQNNADTHTIRVYPRDGFVANSYNYRADVTYIEATRDTETGEFIVHSATANAHRSHGSAATTTINGRAA